MDWFDAICHAFSAVGLGGFSTHDRSIAYFNSAAIEFVLMVLMVVAALNFARHFVALRRLSLETYKQDPEARAIFAVLGLSVVGIALLLSWHGVYPDLLQCLRYAAFNVISQATTSGLTTQDYQSWPVFAPYWMLFLSCIVCSTGSTGGGIKMFRALLLARQTGRELKLLIHPAAMAPVRIGGRPIPDAVGHAVLAFMFLYVVAIAAHDLCDAADRAGLRHRLRSGGRLHQQHRPRLRRARRGAQPARLEPAADLDLHRGDAGGPARDLQHRGADAPGLLAQVGGAPV